MGAGGVADDQQPYSGDALIGVAAAIAAVQILFVAARFYTRFMLRTKVGLDDYLVLLALIASLGKSALYITIVKKGGVGYHFEYISQMPDTLAVMRKYFFARNVIDYPFVITPVKMAFLVFYLRIFTTRKFRLLVYVVGSLVLAVGLGAFIEAFMQCRPIAYYWNRTIPGGSCIHRIQAYWVLCPLNVLTGILILLIPIPAVWNLHATRGKKLAVTGVFLLGGIGTLASILRMSIYFAKVREAMQDPTWFEVRLGILALLEGGMLIIAACLISIWPLFTHIAPRRFRDIFSRQPQKTEHRCWYRGDATVDIESQEKIPQCRGAQKEGWSSTPPSPCSLADLEDQRLLILVDEGATSHETSGPGQRQK
ncbi:hypothetical protein N7535_008807 [Penicillium sp. DV-2018c]|nr:hypothetical protein N7535_008807 [Penicillium sp. DV-2018c]